MPLQYLKNPETQQMGFYDTDTKRWISDINPMVSKFVQNQNIPQTTGMPSNPWDQMIQMNQGNPQLQFQPVVGTEQDFDILKGTTNSPFNTQPGQSSGPTSLEDLDRMVKSGELTDMNLINQYELQLGNAPADTPATTTNTDQVVNIDGSPTVQSAQGANPYNQAPWWSSALNFAGSDLSTEAYSLGMRIGQERGTPGRGLGIVSSAGAFALGATRDLLSGLSTQKMNNYISDWYKKSKQNVNYVPDSQTQDNNYLGGQPYKEGGEIGNKNNPYYAQQLELYNQSKTQSFDFPVDKVLEGEELENWLKEVGMQPSQAHQSTNLFVGGYKPVKVLYNTKSNNFHPIYDEPKKEIETTNTPAPINTTNSNTSTPSTRYFKSNISYSGNPNASAGINIPYMSEEERLQIVNDFKNIKTEQDYKNSPYYQRYGQNAYKQGINYVPTSVASMQEGGPVVQNGNTVGYRMPLDGSLLPDNKQAGVALFPNQYGDINFFAEAYNNLKAQMEQSASTEPYFVDADGNLIPRGVDPNSLTRPYVSMQESRRQARDLNKRIRQDELPYQKVQRDAFYNPNGSKEVASFKDGGEYKKGQYVEFMYGGEKVSGKFDRIENGKIYLQ